jgi:hypothetical protein
MKRLELENLDLKHTLTALDYDSREVQNHSMYRKSNIDHVVRDNLNNTDYVSATI